MFKLRNLGRGTNVNVALMNFAIPECVYLHCSTWGHENYSKFLSEAVFIHMMLYQGPKF